MASAAKILKLLQAELDDATTLLVAAVLEESLTVLSPSVGNAAENYREKAARLRQAKGEA